MRSKEKGKREEGRKWLGKGRSKAGKARKGDGFGLSSKNFSSPRRPRLKRMALNVKRGELCSEYSRFGKATGPGRPRDD